MDDLIADLRERLRDARHVVVLSGAGMSAESGVPTFRDAQTGLWASFRPEDLATPEAFERQPEVVWNWYAWRRELVKRVEPHAGHRALVDLAQRVPHFTLVTQNVDGLHQRAGSIDVIELHGNLMRTVCSACRRPAEHWDSTTVPPRCAHCHNHLRPDVVWFGEALPPEAWRAAEQAVTDADLVLVVGTSGLVEPAASLPRLALHHGAFVAEINLARTPLTPAASVFVPGAAGVILPLLSP